MRSSSSGSAGTPLSAAAQMIIDSLDTNLPQNKRRPRCLIGCSGSVASLKIPELVVTLHKEFDVVVVTTQNAEFFLKRAYEYSLGTKYRLEALGGMTQFLLRDDDEWSMWDRIGDHVLHIELRRWADILLIAPASADFIAKAASGIADNLLLNVVRAWDLKKPCVLCPAMNTVMWEHPSTAVALSVLSQWGWETLGPIEKLLACNEVGNGAMVTVREIHEKLKRLQGSSMNQRSNNISWLDRFTGNPSSKNNNPRDKNSDWIISSLSKVISYSTVMGIGIGIGIAMTMIFFEFSLSRFMMPNEIHLRPNEPHGHTTL